jgi:hypothetical protein
MVNASVFPISRCGQRSARRAPYLTAVISTAVQRDERRANHVAFDLKTELGTLADGFQQERLFRTSELA